MITHGDAHDGKGGIGAWKRGKEHELTGPKSQSNYWFLTSFPRHYRDIDTTNRVNLNEFSAPTYEECASKSLVSSPGSDVSRRLRLNRRSPAVKKRSIFDRNWGTPSRTRKIRVNLFPNKNRLSCVSQFGSAGNSRTSRRDGRVAECASLLMM